jgi:hypothetical protein
MTIAAVAEREVLAKGRADKCVGVLGQADGFEAGQCISRGIGPPFDVVRTSELFTLRSG